MMGSVLIAGCGYVGSRLGSELARTGRRVWGLRRNPSQLPAGIEPLQADLTQPKDLGQLPADVQDVVYAAGPRGREEGDYARAYVEGPIRLLNALEHNRAPVRRLLFVSSTGVYGQQSGEWVDETSPTEPAGASGRHLLEGEQVIRDGPYPACIVRFAGIYGPGRTTLLSRVYQGEARCPSSTRYSNRIHRDDCAGVLAHLLTLDSPDPVYVGVDHEPADLCEVMGWLASRLGVEPPPRAAPADEPDTGRRYRTHKRCSNARLLASGYEFRYPSYREGYPGIIDEFLATGA
jgi:nucleoside-diphosphate-sugar epimerase